MKKLILTVVIIVLLVCLFPFRAQYRDGGSVHYNAILYDVYNVRSFYGDPDIGMNRVEGVIIEIFGVQVYNNTNPHIDKMGDSHDL